MNNQPGVTRQALPRSSARPSIKRSIAKTILAIRIIRIALIALSALTLTVCILMLTLKPSEQETASYRYTATYSAGISVNGQDISGLTYDEAYGLLLPILEKEVHTINLSVLLDGTQWIFTGADLNVTSTLSDVLDEALLLGKGGTMFGNMQEQSRIAKEGRDFTVAFRADPKTLEERIANIAQDMNKAPVEPSAEPDKKANKPSFTYHEGKNGFILDEKALVADITQKLLQGEYQAVLEPVLVETAPEHDLEWVKQNTQQRSVFKTSFKGGSLDDEDRVRNIQKASDLLNGCVVEVGQELSFNEYIGPRYEKDGWALAPGIVNGNTYEMQAGGGICQVSTTFYNALLCAGPEVEITVRKKHSWPSSYVDYSLDATVSTGGPDLAFKNNTGSTLYIFAYADIDNSVMTVYIYGEPLPEGVTYQTRGKTTDEIEPPATEIIEDTSLPVGTKQVEIKSRKGYVATAYRDKLLNGEVVETEELYTDKYRAVQGRVRVGKMPSTGLG